jgi:hypothetical protein
MLTCTACSERSEAQVSQSSGSFDVAALHSRRPEAVFLREDAILAMTGFDSRGLTTGLTRYEKNHRKNGSFFNSFFSPRLSTTATQIISICSRGAGSFMVTTTAPCFLVLQVDVLIMRAFAGLMMIGGEFEVAELAADISKFKPDVVFISGSAPLA